MSAKSQSPSVDFTARVVFDVIAAHSPRLFGTDEILRDMRKEYEMSPISTRIAAYDALEAGYLRLDPCWNLLPPEDRGPAKAFLEKQQRGLNHFHLVEYVLRDEPKGITPSDLFDQVAIRNPDIPMEWQFLAIGRLIEDGKVGVNETHGRLFAVKQNGPAC